MTLCDLHDRAIAPLAFRVAGVRLQPLTIGHARVLDALELWDACTRDDLLIVAALCSGSHGEFLAAIDRPCRTRALTLIHKAKLWLYARLHGRRDWDWDTDAATWGRYVAYHRDEPVASFMGKSKSTFTPGWACMRIVLLGRMGYSPDRIDDMPYTQAIMDYWTWLESAGAVRLRPESVSSFRARMETR